MTTRAEHLDRMDKALDKAWKADNALTRQSWADLALAEQAAAFMSTQ